MEITSVLNLIVAVATFVGGCIATALKLRSVLRADVKAITSDAVKPLLAGQEKTETVLKEVVESVKDHESRLRKQEEFKRYVEGRFDERQEMTQAASALANVLPSDKEPPVGRLKEGS